MTGAIELLPAGGLASSVITTVWVGIMVVTFFNLRFGTTLSGLVVPGYLIPLFIVHPVSGWVILFESVLTYLIARFVADRGLVRLGLGEMFGRDRFFILILVSVLVRIVVDGFMLPLLSEQLAAWGAPYELRSGLHSFGLIIIALCANQFWNGGLKVGGFTLSLYLLVTYAIVSYVLMPLTNFNMTTLGYMYEDIASSILASPKAYIILITAAFVSSRMNLRYGWDFNGILIPSLLALQWYDPFKIVTTFFEAIVIFFGAQLVMKLPVIRTMNLEGARQLLLFFNVGFVYKLILGYAIIVWSPEQKVTDYYGFGYVLGTLMALKMYQKGIAIRFVRTTVQTSFVAIVIASVLGFGLTFSTGGDIERQYSAQDKSLLQHTDVTLSQFVADSRRLTYQSQGVDRIPPLSAFDIGEYRQLFSQLGKLSEANLSVDGDIRLNDIAYRAASLGFNTSWISERYLALVETQASNGRGFYIVDTQATGELAVEVPHALDEPKASGVADRIFSALQARYLAFSGARANRSDDGSDDVLLNAQSVFGQFHQALANNNAIQLRSYTRSAARQLLGIRNAQQDPSLTIKQPGVWIKRSLPRDLPLDRLKAVLGGLDLRWHTPVTPNRQRDTAVKGFAEIYLNAQSLLNVYAFSTSEQQFTQLEQNQRIDGYLQSYLLEDKLNFAAKNTNQYQVADKYQLLYFDQAILQPVLNLIDQLADKPWGPEQQTRLDHISQEAAQFGYQLLLYRHIPTAAEYIIFEERAGGQRHWGTYVLKLGAASRYIIEVPAPIIERNSFEFATMAFETLGARALLVSATHPLANSDGSSQLTSAKNTDSLFNLLHQSLLNHYQHSGPFAVQVRGFTPQPGEDSTKMVVAHFEHRKPGAQQHPGLVLLKQTLTDSGFEIRHPDPDQIHQRFVAQVNAQSRFTKYVDQAQYAEVWLPSVLRQQLNREQVDGALAKKFAALNIEPLSVDIKSWLSEQVFGSLDNQQLTLLLGQLERFKNSQNINQLMVMQQTFGPLKLVLDHNSQHFYLLVFDSQRQVQLVASLSPLNSQQQRISAGGANREQQIDSFVADRQSYLLGSVQP
jgi:hypothetical protein